MDADAAAAFAIVLDDLLLKRGLGTGPDDLRGLAVRSGIDPEQFLLRVIGDTSQQFFSLAGLADELALTRQEQDRLALAFTFGKLT